VPPSSVWSPGKPAESAIEVAKHHVARLIKHLHGARAFLDEGGYLGATSVAQLAANFRRRFARQLDAGEREARPKAESEEEDDDDVWL
jgi:hypothetical protein